LTLKTKGDVNRKRFRRAVREIWNHLGTCTQKILRGKEQEENEYPEKDMEKPG
jgi:hypothetical protein